MDGIGSKCSSGLTGLVREHSRRCPLYVSSRRVSVSRGDRAGHKGVPGQVITHSNPEVFPWCRDWYTGPTFPLFFSLTHQLSIYRVPSMRLVPFWRDTDDQGLGSPLLGAGSKDPPIADVHVGSPLLFPGMLPKPPVSTAICQMTSFLGFEDSCNAACSSMGGRGARDITTLSVNLVLPIPQQWDFLALISYSTF